MSFNRTESAKFAQENQKIVGELHADVDKALADAQAAHDAGEKDEAEAIRKKFGSFEAFKAHFMAAANAVEGSGWAVLATSPLRGELQVLQAEKHQDLTQWGAVPLLILDVWEHAYYLKYQNRRPEYITAFWNVVSWKQVAESLDRA